MKDSVHQRLLTTPLPVDRVAYRVVKKAKPEDVWRPEWKGADHIAFSKEALKTQPPPTGTQKSLLAVIGQRRDRMQIIGYAADQPKNDKGASWVVRCDCGNFEHRSRILRWLGTKAPDSCRECRDRSYRIRGFQNSPRDPAKRETVDIANGKKSSQG